MSISRKKRPVSSLKELFFTDWSELAKRRLRLLVRHRAVIELRDIDSQQANQIIEINMLGFGIEYWLCDITAEHLSFDNLDQDAKLIVIQNARLLLLEGTPLRSRKALQEHGLQAHKVHVRW